MNKNPSSRRVAREAALRVLYTVDVGKQPVEEVMTDTFAAADLDAPAQEFARALVAAVTRSQAEIDERLSGLAVGFPVERQTPVDRNILRLAGAEILYGVGSAPAGVVVNEAVELAKKYSTTESGRFVNGVLGGLVRQGEKGGSAPAEGHDGTELAAPTLTDEMTGEPSPEDAHV